MCDRLVLRLESEMDIAKSKFDFVNIRGSKLTHSYAYSKPNYRLENPYLYSVEVVESKYSKILCIGQLSHRPRLKGRVDEGTML